MCSFFASTEALPVMNITVLDIKEMSANGTQVLSLSHLRRMDVVGTKNIDWRRSSSEILHLRQPCKVTYLKWNVFYRSCVRKYLVYFVIIQKRCFHLIRNVYLLLVLVLLFLLKLQVGLTGACLSDCYFDHCPILHIPYMRCRQTIL